MCIIYCAPCLWLAGNFAKGSQKSCLLCWAQVSPACAVLVLWARLLTSCWSYTGKQRHRAAELQKVPSALIGFLADNSCRALAASFYSSCARLIRRLCSDATGPL